MKTEESKRIRDKDLVDACVARIKRRLKLRRGKDQIAQNWIAGLAANESIDELARKSNRYMPVRISSTSLKVVDRRSMLDGLLRWDAVLPIDDLSGRNEFMDLRARLSDGPALTKADKEMLCWLELNAELVAEDCEEHARLRGKLWRDAIVFQGTDLEVWHFLLRQHLMFLG